MPSIPDLILLLANNTASAVNEEIGLLREEFGEARLERTAKFSQKGAFGSLDFGEITVLEDTQLFERQLEGDAGILSPHTVDIVSIKIMLPRGANGIATELEVGVLTVHDFGYDQDYTFKAQKEQRPDGVVLEWRMEKPSGIRHRLKGNYTYRLVNPSTT